jgi:hypothetical protein
MNIDWKSILTEWVELQRLVYFPGDIIYEENNSYLGFPGANMAQIHESESRLGLIFPHSYKEFISFTNGWFKNSIGFAYNHLLPIEEIDWFRNKEIDWIQIYAETCGIKYEDIPVFMDRINPYEVDYEDDIFFLRCIKSALQISGRGDSDVILLIPNIVFDDGEWEAWHFADWMGTADRYISFEQLMINKYMNDKNRIKKSRNIDT